MPTTTTKVSNGSGRGRRGARRETRAEVSARLRRQIHVLHVLHGADRPLQKLILRRAGKELVTTLAECSLNVLSSNQPVSPNCRRALCKYKTVLRKLAQSHSRLSWRRKRRLLVGQRGGFLGILLGSVLSGLLSRVLAS